jgi:hypothetical protein
MGRGRSRRLWVVERGNVYTIFTVLYGQGGTGQPGAVDITMPCYQVQLTRSKNWARKAKHRICSKILSIERSCHISFPDAVLPSACLSPRRHLRSFQLTHPAIRSTNCALTETHRNISPIASTNFSPTGTVCFYACSYALTDMLTTAHVSSHTPAQDTVAHCSTLHPYRDRPQTTTSG